MQVTDLHVTKNIPLPTPAQLMEEVSRTAEQAAFMAESRDVIRDILSGKDSRFLLIVGGP